MTTREADMLEQVIVAELPRWITEHPTLRAQLQDALSGAAPDTPRRMTYEEFLAWADEDALAEWVAVPGTDVGEVVMTSPASNRHQDIVDFLVSVLRPFVQVYQLGIVRSAPFQMKLEHGREPDLLFVASENLSRLKETYLDGPADIAIEIVSPEGLERDRGAKFVEYEAGGILEYWLIDPLRQWAEFYRLGEDGRYRTAFAGDEGEYRSRVLPGFWLRVEWLWQEPLPKTLDVLRELGLLG
jgi:Uma2 family endonuclease